MGPGIVTLKENFSFLFCLHSYNLCLHIASRTDVSLFQKIHKDNPTCPKNGTHAFPSRYLSFEFLLCLWILVSPLHTLPLWLWFIVRYPGLISGDDDVKEITHCLIPFQKTGTILQSAPYGMSLAFVETTWHTISCIPECSKLFSMCQNPICTLSHISRIFTNQSINSRLIFRHCCSARTDWPWHILQTTTTITDMPNPSQLKFSPDNYILYVTSHEQETIWRHYFQCDLRTSLRPPLMSLPSGHFQRHFFHKILYVFLASFMYAPRFQYPNNTRLVKSMRL
jgi:hypothetical protein